MNVTTAMPKSTTAGNMSFFLLSFQLGLLFFFQTVIGLVVGTSTLVIGIGLPLLFATLAFVRSIAAIERRVVESLLRVPLPSRSTFFSQSHEAFLRRLGNLVRDPLTWTNTIYMLLKLPLGVISFSLTFVLSSMSLALSSLPLIYLLNLFIDAILLKSGIPSTSYIIPTFIEIHRAQLDLMMFAKSFLGVPVGLMTWFVTRFLLNGLAHLWGEIARAQF